MRLSTPSSRPGLPKSHPGDRSALLIGFVSLLFCAALHAAAADPPPTTGLQRRIGDLIEQLGSSQFKVREAATRELSDLGIKVVAPIVDAINRGDPEVGLRGMTVLRQIFISTDFPASDAAETALDRLADSKQAVTSRLAKQILRQQSPVRSELAAAKLRALGAHVSVHKSVDATGRRWIISSIELTTEWKGSVADLIHIRRLSNVTSVRLSTPRATDAWLVHFKRLTALRTLSLNNTAITDAGLKRLAHLDQLVELNLKDTQIKGPGLEYLAKLKKLKTLSLNRTLVGDDDLKHFRGLTELRGLDLDATRVTDSGLAHLVALTNLKWLGLNGTQVGDAGVMHLRQLSYLRRLHIKGTRLTEAGANALKSAMPRLSLIGTP